MFGGTAHVHAHTECLDARMRGVPTSEDAIALVGVWCHGLLLVISLVFLTGRKKTNITITISRAVILKATSVHLSYVIGKWWRGVYVLSILWKVWSHLCERHIALFQVAVLRFCIRLLRLG